MTVQQCTIVYMRRKTKGVSVECEMGMRSRRQISPSHLPLLCTCCVNSLLEIVLQSLLLAVFVTLGYDRTRLSDKLRVCLSVGPSVTC